MLLMVALVLVLTRVWVEIHLMGGSRVALNLAQKDVAAWSGDGPASPGLAPHRHCCHYCYCHFEEWGICLAHLTIKVSQAASLHPLNHWSLIFLSPRHKQSSFRHAIARIKGTVVKTTLSKFLTKLLQGFCPYWFGSIESQIPTAQVKTS